MILGHSEIVRLIQEKKLLEGYEEKNIQGAGVDLRVGHAFKLKGPGHMKIDDRKLPELEEIEGRHITLKSGEYILVKTMETVNLPLDIAARFLPRSTLHRSGVYQFHAFCDPGYNGELTFGMKNLGEFDYEFERGSRVTQIIFEKVEGQTKKYNGRYQGGKIT